MRVFLASPVLLMLAVAPALAANRALLVGVGNYPDRDLHLPGIDKDLEVEQQILGRLGFRPEEVRTLRDSEATEARIRREIGTWLTSGVRPDDRVVFYFSGHGSLARTSSGRVEGVLIPYDVQAANGQLMHALSGPELGELLEASPSRRMLTIIDACHSGHLTDAKGLDFTPKMFRYPGMPEQDAAFTLGSTKSVSGASGKHALLAACRRDEAAGATRSGSILTTAWARIAGELLSRRSPVTLRTLHPLVLRAVEARQHPEISGNSALLDVDWTVSNSSPPVSTPTPVQGRDWDLVQQVYRARSGDLPLRLSKSTYRSGERMTLEVDIPAEGYLNIVSMGRRDAAATILFPNEYARDNRVKPGKLRVPNSPEYDLGQELEQPGQEENEILVIFTTRQLDLFSTGLNGNLFRSFTDKTRGTVVKPGSGFSAALGAYSIVR